MNYIIKGLKIVMMDIINNHMLKKNKYNKKFKSKNLKLEDYDYDRWFAEDELNDEEKLDDMLPRGDKEVKEGKELKILIPKKLLTRLPILLAQIKAENNLFKFKNEIRQILYLLYQHNKITKKVYNNLIKSL